MNCCNEMAFNNPDLKNNNIARQKTHHTLISDLPQQPVKDLSIFINNLINALGRISCFLGSLKWILGCGLDRTEWLILDYATQEIGYLFGITAYFFGGSFYR